MSNRDSALPRPRNVEIDPGVGSNSLASARILEADLPVVLDDDPEETSAMCLCAKSGELEPGLSGVKPHMGDVRNPRNFRRARACGSSPQRDRERYATGRN